MVSTKLFDTDDEVELLYIMSEYVPSNQSYYYKYESRIVNEDGSLILKVEGASYAEIIEIADNEAKLLIYSYDYSSYPYKTNTYIYNLDAYASVNNPVNFSVIPNSQNALKSFPNPAKDTITLSYSLPDNTQDATLNIMNINGKIMKSFTIDNHFENLKVDVSNFNSGVYFYTIATGNKITASSKFIVQ